MSDAAKPRAGVIGLGAMGMGMARVLAGKGFSVTAFDLSAEALARAGAAGIDTAQTSDDVFAAADVIVLSLPAARQVQTVVEGALSSGALAAGDTRIVLDTSTSEAAVSRALAQTLAGAGHGFLDAPVSGGPSGAASGTLAMMIGGEAPHLAQARPVIEAIADKILHVGPSGAGNVAKLVNNMLVASHMLTTLEALRLAEAAGVGAEDALRVINSATGRSAISEVHFPNWVLPRRFDSGFSTGLMRKDVRLARELAASVGCAMPLADLVADLWSEPRSRLNDQDDFMLMGDPQVARFDKTETTNG